MFLLVILSLTATLSYLVILLCIIENIFIVHCEKGFYYYIASIGIQFGT